MKTILLSIIKNKLKGKFETRFKFNSSIGTIEGYPGSIGRDISIKNDIGIKSILIKGQIYPVRFNQYIRIERNEVYIGDIYTTLLGDIEYEITIHSIHDGYLLSITNTNPMPSSIKCTDVNIQDNIPIKVFYDTNKNYPFTSPENLYTKLPKGLFITRNKLEGFENTKVTILRRSTYGATVTNPTMEMEIQLDKINKMMIDDNKFIINDYTIRLATFSWNINVYGDKKNIIIVITYR